jgi:hypothetical protein
VRAVVERNGGHRGHRHIDQAVGAERQQYLAIGHGEGGAPLSRIRERQTRLGQTRVEVNGMRHDRSTDNAHGECDTARPTKSRNEHASGDTAPVRRRDHQLNQVTRGDDADTATDQDFYRPKARGAAGSAPNMWRSRQGAY